MVSSWQGWSIHTPLGEPSGAPCAAGQIVATGPGPDSTQEERYTWLMMVHPPKAAAPLQMVPLPLCPTCTPFPPILQGLGLDLTSSLKPPLTPPSPNEPYLHRGFKTPEAAGFSDLLPLPSVPIHSFFPQNFVHTCWMILGGKAACRAMEGKTSSLFHSLET